MTNQVDDTSAPFLASILHPTDFSTSSVFAFAHALKVALTTQCRLTMLHVSSDAGSVRWDEFPGVRATLEAWGLIPKGSPKSAVPELGINVAKVIARESDPAKAVLKFLDEHDVDLVVLATHRHEGVARLFHKAVAEPVARESGQMTLFVPEGVKGFVSWDDGSVTLNSIVIPVADTPRAEPAIDAAARLVQRLAAPSGVFTLVHIGDRMPIDVASCPEVAGWTWNAECRSGDVIGGIADVANEQKAGVIVMSTDGRNGFLDALRGSHSERLLRHVECPLLAVPVRSPARV